MLKKLKLAERACNLFAILISIPTLAALCGHEANRTAVVVLLAVVFVLAFIASRLRKRINVIQLEEHEKLPINAVKARVVKRRVGYRYSAGGRSGAVRSGAPMYYVTFETEAGKLMELYVSRDVYFANPEEKTGILRHKGDEFISFN